MISSSSRRSVMGCVLFPGNSSAHRHCNYMVQCGKAVAPLQGMYARSSYWESLSFDRRHLHMVRTLSKLHPDWVFSHHTAALIHGLYVAYPDIRQIHRCVAYGTRNGPGPICSHALGNREYELVDSIKVVSFEQTVLDCLRILDFKQALAIADSSCRVKGMTPGELMMAINAKASKHLSGMETARLAIRHANPLSESGGESIARATMLMNGYEAPKLQVEMPDLVDGESKYRVDFYWELPDGSKIIGEFDGREKYTNSEMTRGREAVEVLADERERESHINALRIPVMRMSYSTVANQSKFIEVMEAFGVPHADRPWPYGA